MIRRYLVLLALVSLAACGRPLTQAERQFMQGLQGDGFDPGPVRIVENPLVGLREVTYPARPRTTCRERILPPPDGPTISASTAGVSLFQHLHTSEGFFLEDYVDRPDDAVNLVAAMFFAHEMTHVWQWQNRDLTNYHPLRAAREHLTTEDPYLFDGDAEAAFLDYGYEQQASLVEEYVCCRALDPRGARTARLRALLSDYMPISQTLAGLDGRDILLPWDGAELRGICS
ncbi:hypothetical protein HKCCE3408_17355 [Rhodobacterales bacterium HKCCE3408]|nr:hypothetical protein [Rhodobacterales bacterium HKCCE3408]